MPTYQYACKDCGHAFEQVQKFTDDALTECPQCQGRLRKIFNAVGVVFKGPGFYRTDSRSAANGSATEGSKSGPDSKPDATDSAPGKKDSGSGSKPDSTSGSKAAPSPAAATGQAKSTASSASNS